MDNINEALAQLGLRIAHLRRQRLQPQDDFARSAGLSRSTLVEIEKGSPKVEMGNYVKALAALGRLDELVALAAVEAPVDGERRRVSRGRTYRLQPTHRERETRRQEAFLASNHPARFGIWDGVPQAVLDPPDLESTW